MYYAYFVAILGLGFGAMGVDYVVALPIMILALGLRAAYQILLPNEFLSGGPSLYQRYVANLTERGTLAEKPWIGFAVLSIGFGSIIGSITFWLGKTLN